MTIMIVQLSKLKKENCQMLAYPLNVKYSLGLFVEYLYWRYNEYVDIMNIF